MATTEFVARTIAVMAAAYPNATITRETIQVYAHDLSDIPDDVLDLAAADCRATCKWFPTIAEIRAAAARIQSGADTLPPAGEAWGEFVRLASRHADMPPIDNPILEKTIRAMGWTYLTTSENGMSDRARFCDLYDEYARRGVRTLVAPPQLAGGRVADALAGLTKRLRAPTKETK